MGEKKFYSQKFKTAFDALKRRIGRLPPVDPYVRRVQKLTYLQKDL